MVHQVDTNRVTRAGASAGGTGRWLGLILVAAFLVRLPGLAGGLPDINRYFWDSDEGALAHIIMGFGTGDLNPHAFSQPTLFLYVVFVLYGLFYLAGRVFGAFGGPQDFAYAYFVDPTPFYLIGRSVSLVAGLLTIWLTAKLGTRLFGRRVGLTAAALLTIAELHVQMSQVMKTDAASVLFVVAALWFAVDVVERSTWRAACLAGTCAGLAAATRYPSGIVMLAVIGAHVLAAARRGRPVWHALLEKKFWVSTIAIPAAFLAASPFTVIDWSTFREQLGLLNQQLAVAGDTFGVGYRPNYWRLHWVQLAEPGALGPTLTMLGAAGLLVSVARHRWQDLLLLPLPLVLYWFYSDNRLFTRTLVPAPYLLPAIPVMLVLGARAIVEALDWAGRKRAYAAAAIVLALAPYAGATLMASVALAQPSTTVVARGWIEAHVPRGSRILMDAGRVPQLTFTDAALLRLRTMRPVPQDGRLTPSRREALDADLSDLEALRVKSLTEVGVPYDVYLIGDATINVPDASRGLLEQVVARYGIEYVVTSSHIYGNFFDDPLDEVRGLRGRYRQFVESQPSVPAAWRNQQAFYAEVERRCQLMAEIAPEPLRRAGPRIKVYRVPDRLRDHAH